MHNDLRGARSRAERHGPERARNRNREGETDGDTRIKRKGDNAPCSALAVGQRVEVEGTQQSDGSVLAKKIGIED